LFVDNRFSNKIFPNLSVFIFSINNSRREQFIHIRAQKHRNFYFQLIMAYSIHKLESNVFDLIVDRTFYKIQKSLQIIFIESILVIIIINN
jgi:hypothetical protein